MMGEIDPNQMASALRRFPIHGLPEGVQNMSTNDAKKFLDEVNKDPNLQKKLQDHQGQLANIGKDHGFNFTQAELQEELRERWAVSKPKDDPDTCTMP